MVKPDSGTQKVSLRGGSFDGAVAEALPPARALRLNVVDGDDHWAEIYLYQLNTTVEVAQHGALPVMTYFGRQRVE